MRVPRSSRCRLPGADFLGRVAQAGWLYAASPGGVATVDTGGATAAVDAPRVERIDVSYAYPAYTHLAPRVDRGGGDVFAPEGTAVTITVHADAPVRAGSLQFASGGAVTLASAGDTALAATFDVMRDDAYRVALAGSDTAASEYVVRAIPDEPPVIDIRRPGGRSRDHAGRRGGDRSPRGGRLWPARTGTRLHRRWP